MSATTSASVTTSVSVSASVALHSTVAYFYARFAVQAAESIPIVFANLLTLVAVKRTRKLRQTSANSLTASLALADGMIGVLLLPTKIASRTCQQAVWIGSTCLIGGPYYAVFAISLSTLLAIAVDRCLAVGRPLTYGKLMTVKRTRTIALSIWITRLTPWEALSRYYGSRIRVGEYRPGAAQDLFPRQLTFLLVQIEVLLPIVANLVLYAFIYAKLRTRKPVVCPLASMNAVETSEQKEPSKQTKAFTKMMVLVLGYLIIASLPYYILAPMYKVNDPKTPSWCVYSFDAAMFLFFGNSFVNPLIYSWKNRHFREAYSKIWKCHRSERD